MLAKLAQTVHDLPAVGPVWFLKRYFALVVVETFLPPLATLLWTLVCLDAMYDMLHCLYMWCYAVTAKRESAEGRITLSVALAREIEVRWIATAETAQAFDAAATAIGGDIAAAIALAGGTRLLLTPLPFVYEVEFFDESKDKLYVARLSRHRAQRIFTACARQLRVAAGP